MFESVERKISLLKNLFAACANTAARYQLIIEMGLQLPSYKGTHDPCYLVQGCQSRLYLFSERQSDLTLVFYADSDALISKGLASLLLTVYDSETPEVILKHQSTFLNDLQIHSSLSPSRSNGLSNLHLHMKKLALNYLVLKPLK